MIDALDIESLKATANKYLKEEAKIQVVSNAGKKVIS
jgi:hypothetical protein